MKRMQLTGKIFVALLTFALGVVAVACLAYYQPAQIQTTKEASPSQTNEETQKLEN